MKKLLIICFIILSLCSSCSNTKDTIDNYQTSNEELYQDSLLLDGDDNMKQSIFNFWNQR